MTVILWFIVLFVSLAVLSKSADLFTEAAERIGLHFGMSAFVIGVSIVAIGTSLPELVSSLIAVFSSSSEIVIGNVVGSNIANILLILGVAALVAKDIYFDDTLWSDLFVLVFSALLLLVFSLDNRIVFGESLILVFCFFVYVGYVLRRRDSLAVLDSDFPLYETTESRVVFSWSIYLRLFIYLGLLLIGARYTILSVISLSESLGIGSEILAATVVAFGTSLPELAVSVSAARKGKAAIAIGNILGSNIFNIFMVLGFSGLLGTLLVTPTMHSTGFIFLTFATALYCVMLLDRRTTFIEGFFLVVMYLLFLLQIVGVM